MLRTSDLDYDLPDECIATHPAHPRDAARLMVVHRGQHSQPHDRTIADLPALLRPGDLLVLNTSRVVPARLLGTRADTGGKAEGLWLGVALDRPGRPWRVLIKARRVRPGVVITLDEALPDGPAQPSPFSLCLLERSPEAGEEGAWLCRLEGPDAGADPMSVLARVGRVPLPPYIRAARRKLHEPDETRADADEYQCVYADAGRAGSVAAPTAGLHFTPALLDRLAAAGVATAHVVLHVGPGTFKPVETETVQAHPMHAEWCEFPADSARAIIAARARGGRVIAVGTTTARTLESFGDAESIAVGGASGWSRLLITPGHAWRNLDALLTNFHLPRSTLLALVAAMLPDGVPELLRHYRAAIQRRYRFYSFGDAMLIL